MHMVRFFFGLALVLTGACAPTVGTSLSRQPRGVISTGVLTRRDLSQFETAHDLYEVIQSLNPGFIVHRGRVVSVAVDGMLLGNAETLRQIVPSTVSEVRLLEGPDATLRFGAMHNGAVLLVTTKRR